MLSCSQEGACYNISLPCVGTILQKGADRISSSVKLACRIEFEAHPFVIASEQCWGATAVKEGRKEGVIKNT